MNVLSEFGFVGLMDFWTLPLVRGATDHGFSSIMPDIFNVYLVSSC